MQKMKDGKEGNVEESKNSQVSNEVKRGTEIGLNMRIGRRNRGGGSNGKEAREVGQAGRKGGREGVITKKNTSIKKKHK